MHVQRSVISLKSRQMQSQSNGGFRVHRKFGRNAILIIYFEETAASKKRLKCVTTETKVRTEVCNDADYCHCLSYTSGLSFYRNKCVSEICPPSDATQLADISSLRDFSE